MVTIDSQALSVLVEEKTAVQCALREEMEKRVQLEEEMKHARHSAFHSGDFQQVSQQLAAANSSVWLFQVRFRI